MMQFISIPSTNARFSKFYFMFQYISSCLIILESIVGFFGIPDYFRPISAVNVFIFYLFFLGTNFLMFIKKSGQLSFELFMILEVCAGSFIQYAVGLIMYFSRIPYYSELSEIVIAGFNMCILNNNQMNKRSISITFNADTKPLIIIGITFLVIRLSLINGVASPYWDDQMLDDMALGFTNNFTQLYIPFAKAPYYDAVFEIAFGIFLGTIMKLGWTQGSPTALLIYTKIYLVILTTFIIFPIYAYLSRIIKDRKARFIILVILAFNQYIFLEGSYLLTNTLFMMFFTTALYFFIRVLENDGPANENMIFCIIASGLTIATKYNGLMLYAMEIVMLCLFIFIPKIRDVTIHGKQRFQRMSKISLPNFSGSSYSSMSSITTKLSRPLKSRCRTIIAHPLFRLLIFQLIVLFIFCGTIQIDYYLHNGITISDYNLYYLPYGYFGKGTDAQFYTQVGGFSFTWLWERLSINFPWYVIHFTQLIGFIHVSSIDNNLRMWLNYPISIICVAIFGISMIYVWYRTARTNVLSSFFQLSVFLLTFASIILWGEKDYFFYRFTYPFMIMIIPPIYTTFKDFLTRIQHSLRMNFNVEKMTSLLLLPFLAITLYGTIGFLLWMYTGDPMLIYGYQIWQFTGTMVTHGGIFSDYIISILEGSIQSTGIIMDIIGLIITGIIVGVTGVFIHKKNYPQTT